MNKKNNGFTLIEAVVSSLILAAGAMIVCTLAGNCLVNNAEGAQYEQAWRLVDECLDRAAAKAMETPREILQNHKIIKGNFAPRFPQYNYTVKIEQTNNEKLYQVSATVTWTIAQQTRQVSAVTVMSDW